MDIKRKLQKNKKLRNRGRKVNFEVRDKLVTLLEVSSYRRDHLIEYLHVIQDSQGHINEDYITALASLLKISQTEVYEVATFYHHFDIIKGDEKTPPSLTVRVCDSVTCEINGASQLAQSLDVDASLVDQASLYSKADLLSEMVNEFPELQGLMGSYYAKACGLPAEVCLAIKDHYSPLGPKDVCPQAIISIVVALSDKLDTLESFWKINQKPTGSSDPFALRRAALGVIRLLIENKISLDLGHYLYDLEDDKVSDLISFIHERLKVFLREKNIRYDVIDACLLSKNNSNIHHLFLKAEALSERLKLKTTENLVQSFKRVNNILKQAEKLDGVIYELEPDMEFFEGPEEHELFVGLHKVSDAVIARLLKNNFVYLNKIADIKKVHYL